MEDSVTLLRRCLAVLNDTPVASYDMNTLLSSLHEHCTKITLELARLKSVTGYPNNSEVARFLALLARHDEAYLREAEDFEVKCGTLAADLGRLLSASGQPIEADKFTLLSDELNKRFTIKSYVVDTLFREIVALVNRSIPSLRSPDNIDFFFSGWAAIRFADLQASTFQAHLLELRSGELRVSDKDNSLVGKYSLAHITMSVSLAPEREVVLEPLGRVREVSTGPSLELWTKAFARALAGDR